MNNRILTTAVLAFVLPLGVLTFVREDDLQELVAVDPASAPGKVLYFTAPS